LLFVVCWIYRSQNALRAARLSRLEPPSRRRRDLGGAVAVVTLDRLFKKVGHLNTI